VDCEALRDLLHGYIDGHLDLGRDLEIERHLQGCTACAEAVKGHQALRTAFRGAALYERAPADLRARLRASLRRESGSQPSFLARRWPWLRVAAALAFLTLLAWGSASLWSRHAAADGLAQQVVASHVRALMPGHRHDVESADGHTVKPWFNGRVDFSPPVKDLTAEGFPLTGARLDYVAHRAVAALVYQRRGHVISLFVWPAAGAAAAPRAATLQGYHLISWHDADLAYWAISDLNEPELQEFVALFRR
jgi:anti-sigma factor RsiW